jgi:hypothetical protein
MTVGPVLVKGAASLAALREAAVAGAGAAQGQFARAGGVSGGDAEELFELRAVAIRAVRLFAAADEELELGIAALAGVFVEGHWRVQGSGFRVQGSDLQA